MMIDELLYRTIIKNIPILCVDIIIQNENLDYLLAKRINQPLQDEWWVVGGRVNLGENCDDAAKRKLKEELNLEINELNFIGYYEDCFENNSFDNNVKYHTLSIVFKCTIKSTKNINLDNQHNEIGWFKHLPLRLKIKN